jgi:dTDP-4-amino-4,6-dideoxygalactose transaminase
MEFERPFAEWQGSRFAISTTNGTSALHVALTALGLGPGDEVIVPSYTFIASSFSVVQAGAIPRFADVNLDDHCLNVASTAKLVTERTKAVVPVHLYGNIADLERELSYIHNMVGWNYRLTEMQSAIGLAELDRMDTWNMPRRRRNAHIIMNALADELLVKFRPIDTPDRQNG